MSLVKSVQDEQIKDAIKYGASAVYSVSGGQDGCRCRLKCFILTAKQFQKHEAKTWSINTGKVQAISRD